MDLYEAPYIQKVKQTRTEKQHREKDKERIERRGGGGRDKRGRESEKE